MKNKYSQNKGQKLLLFFNNQEFKVIKKAEFI